jgi:serine/threonine-protein kinase
MSHPPAPEPLRTLLAQAGDLPASRLVEVLLLDQQQRWQAGERIPAELYLQWCPALQANAEHVLDLVYGEFLLREELGEQPDLAEYLRRFPSQAAALKLQVELHQAMGPKAERTARHTLSAAPVATVAAPGEVGATPPATMAWPSVPGYQIEGELGRGGMSIVYKALHLGLQRHVALKMLRAGDAAEPDQLARFRREAEAVAQLQHPHIVQIYEVGEQVGRPYWALEFVDGGSLDKRLTGTPQPARQAAQLVETLARAMHHAHQHGIIHRDLKPANILLSTEYHVPRTEVSESTPQAALSTRRSVPNPQHSAPGTPYAVLRTAVPKITDFGLAKRLDVNGGQTQSGVIMGTPSYMAPEQAAGRSKEVGPAADIYALGGILYELLTGRPPFQGETVSDIILQVISHEPVQPHVLQPKVPRDLLGPRFYGNRKI